MYVVCIIMASRSSISFVHFMFRIITLITSFTLTISSQPSTEVKSLIYSLQNKYCGRQFCTSDPLQEPPLCNEDTIQVMLDPVTNKTLHKVSSTQRQRVPTCSECSCGDSCSLYGNCCADNRFGREYYFDCHEIYHYVPEGVANMFAYVVTKCLRDAPNYSEDLAENCEHGELGYIPDGRLVTALHPEYHTSVTFRNKYCALCYNIKNYTPLDVYITCDDDFDWPHHADINSLLRSFSNSSGCKIATDHLYTEHSSTCHRYFGMISTCNVTGKWKEYNKTLETACHYYLNPTLNYRNIFCALCNGISNEDLMCPNFDYGIRATRVYLMPFSAIVNFHNSDVEVIRGSSSYPIRRIGKQEEYQCRVGDVFDAISEKCREVYCPLSMHRENTTCTKVVLTETYVVTSWMITAYYTDNIIIPYGESFSHVGRPVIKALQEQLTELGFFIHSSSSRDFASIHSLHSLVLKKSQLELGLLLLEDYRLELSRQRLMDVTCFTLNITWLEQTVGVHAVPESNPKDVTDMVMVSRHGSANVPFEFSDIDFSKTIIVPLAFNASCPMIRFESNEVLFVNGSVIMHDNTVLGEDAYFVKDTDNYFLCLHAALQPKKLGRTLSEVTKTSSLATQALAPEVRLFVFLPLVSLVFFHLVFQMGLWY